MRRLPVSLFPLLLTSAFLAAQAPAPPQLAKGYATIQEDALRKDLSYIASDALEGRMSLQPGDQSAVHWIAEQFKTAGLTPPATAEDGQPSFLQPVPLIEYRPDREKTTVTLTRAGKPTVWKAPAVLGAYKHATDLTAPVVFAGFGITAPELGYDDYKGLDARGKIVLVFDHEPQEDNPQSIFNGTGNTRYATTRVKLLNAQKHGAVALLVVPEPNRKHLTNAERAARIGGGISRTTPLPSQALADDELHIPALVVNDEVANDLLATEAAAHKTTGKAEASALQSAIDKNLTPQPRTLPDTTLALHLVNLFERTGTSWNVAGLVQGSDSSLGAETILITAHHDHDGETPCPAADPAKPGQESGGVDDHSNPTPPGAKCMQIWHGADDNGSGTVGVVTLARAFAANPAKPKRSILFVVFAAEERGLLGAYYMAQHPLRPLATTRAQINFDMIGRDEKPSRQTEGLIEIPADTSNRLNLIGALYSPQYDAVVKQENARVGLTLDDRFDHESALNVFFRSDQFPFVLHDIPAFWWFTGFHPDYHHITDTVDKIDFPKMKKILDLAYLTAWRFATDPTTPKFIPNPSPPH
ncbi:MAG TPA: M20/M25/M40 family metallo-hydrolase [Terracidiphilus sp.]